MEEAAGAVTRLRGLLLVVVAHASQPMMRLAQRSNTTQHDARVIRATEEATITVHIY